ncbi:hypothetical protein DFQ26_001953 [Actinomortierella ambigua]|nr:hypothetical protein DFQ26_001953 [Actinomortierella ambigua]
MALMREEDLLTSFLIDNEFRDTVSFAQFVRLFPSKYHAHPDLKDLYRAYLGSRSRLRALVRDNITQHAAYQREEVEAGQRVALQQQQQAQRRRSARIRAHGRLEEVDEHHGAVVPASSSAADTIDGSAAMELSSGSHDDAGDNSDDDMDIEGVETHLSLSQAIEELLLAQGAFESEIGRMERECRQHAEDIQSADQKLGNVKVPSEPFLDLQESDLLENLEK